LQFVISLNLSRRHLNESQRAVVAEKIANMHSGERTDLQPNANLHKVELNLDIPIVIPPKVSLQNASDMLNVSRRSVASVSEIQKKAPERIAEMEVGRNWDNSANLPNMIQMANLPLDKF